MKNRFYLIAILILIVLVTGCNKEDKKSIILATTTSTDSSGLLEYLLPHFEEDKGIEVKVVAVGTGAALEKGRNGDADILIVHDTVRELIFMNNEYGIKRNDLMYNDFVLVGPSEIKENGGSLKDVLEKIKTDKLTFISRGDGSGTESKEKSLWNEYEITHDSDWYLESGQGMGSTLNMASEQEAYTLTDRATFYFMKDDLELEIVYENKEKLNNQYGVILINPNKHDHIKYEDATIFYDWLLSEKGQDLIEQYRIEEFGENLFIANADEDE